MRSSQPSRRAIAASTHSVSALAAFAERCWRRRAGRAQGMSRRAEVLSPLALGSVRGCIGFAGLASECATGESRGDGATIPWGLGGQAERRTRGRSRSPHVHLRDTGAQVFLSPPIVGASTRCTMTSIAVRSKVPAIAGRAARWDRRAATRRRRQAQAPPRARGRPTQASHCSEPDLNSVSLSWPAPRMCARRGVPRTIASARILPFVTPVFCREPCAAPDVIDTVVVPTSWATIAAKVSS